MRKSVIAVMALCALALSFNSIARKTYTLQELEDMKNSGLLKGTERFVMIEETLSDALTGTKDAEAVLRPSRGRIGAGTELIAYDAIGNARFLTTMAREYYGNPDFWPYIYEENSDRFGHPDRIKPGTMVLIPNLEKYNVNPRNPADIEKAKRLGKEIYARYGKTI